MDDSATLGIIEIYRRRARRYDWTTLLLYLVGFRHRTYRKQAVQALHLRLGDTVVDLGCGTGLNFSLLQEQIGPKGRLIGVDLGGRFVVLDFKMPSSWLMSKAAPVLAKLMTGPFGGTIEMTSREPWQSLRKYLARTECTELFLGGAYIAASDKCSAWSPGS